MPVATVWPATLPSISAFGGLEERTMANANSYKLTLDYLLNMMMQEGLVGQKKALEVKSLFDRQAGAGISSGHRGTTKPIIQVEDPIDFVTSLKLPFPNGYEGQIIDDEIIAKLIAKNTGHTYRKIDARDLDLELVTSILPQSFAYKNLTVPLGMAGSKLEVAVVNPFNKMVLADVQRVTNVPLELIIVAKSNLKKIIGELYAFRASVVGAEGQYSGAGSITSLSLANLEQYVQLKNTAEIKEDDEHIRNVVDFLFSEAFEKQASDIHLEPKRDKLLVRMRFDGMLHDMYSLPKVIYPAVISRIKTMSRLDIAERRRPQDGRIKISKQNAEAEVRVSTVPVAFGEKAVMRILDPEALFMELEHVFVNSKEYKLWEEFITNPHGIILVTGPTGSGKTTTLYSTLRRVASPAVNITTVEDPIEMVHEEFNQIAVQPKIGVTFASIIRNILRQDPDIIMIGEMRDAETAENAVQAALTGHLVFSTLHTNDAPGAVTRMAELGVQPFLISSTVLGVMAQRLLRRVCKYCQEEFVLAKEYAQEVGIYTETDLNLKRGCGCEMCRDTGYRGRAATVEIMPFSTALGQATLAGQNAQQIKDLARREGMATLRENAVTLMLKGVTTIDEVMRVTMAD